MVGDDGVGDDYDHDHYHDYTATTTTIATKARVRVHSGTAENIIRYVHNTRRPLKIFRVGSTTRRRVRGFSATLSFVPACPTVYTRFPSLPVSFLLIADIRRLTRPLCSGHKPHSEQFRQFAFEGLDTFTLSIFLRLLLLFILFSLLFHSHVPSRYLFSFGFLFCFISFFLCCLLLLLLRTMSWPIFFLFCSILHRMHRGIAAQAENLSRRGGSGFNVQRSLSNL